MFICPPISVSVWMIAHLPSCLHIFFICLPWLFMSPSVSICLWLKPCLSVSHLYVCISVCLYLNLSVCSSAWFCLNFFLHMSVYVCRSTFICLSVSVFGSLYICFSVCLCLSQSGYLWLCFCFVSFSVYVSVHPWLFLSVSVSLSFPCCYVFFFLSLFLCLSACVFCFICLYILSFGVCLFCLFKSLFIAYFLFI